MSERIEHDSMGEVRVPADALWRAQTQRAVENFPISGTPIEPALIVRALARIKAAAATVNAELGVLDTEQARGDREPRPTRSPTGEHDDQFPIDVFQTGSGTSTNMNINEVLATLAAGRPASTSTPTTTSTPASRSNDTFPTAIHVAAAVARRATWCRRWSTWRRRWSARRPSSPTS